MPESLPSLPTGYVQRISNLGELELIEQPSINGTTVLLIVVGLPIAISGLSSILTSGMNLGAIALGLLALGVGLPIALIAARLIFVRRRWLFGPGAVTYELGTWLLPMSRRQSYPGVAAIEIRHRLTKTIVSVDSVVIRTISGSDLLVDAADNAPHGCFKVVVWRGLQVGFEFWMTGQASPRRPPKLQDSWAQAGPIEASLAEVQDEIAPRIVMLAEFLTAATVVPTRVLVERNRGRLASIGGD